MYKTPEPREFSFNDIQGSVPLKFGSMYIRVDMHTEFYADDHILTSQQALASFEMPGYLQANMNHGELDEHEDERRRAANRRRMARELAIKRKKLLEQLMDREKIIRAKIKELEENIRNKLTEELRNKLQDELDKMKKELLEKLQDLQNQIDQFQAKKAAQNQKKEARDNKMSLIAEDKIRTGVRIQIDEITSKKFKTKNSIKVVFGLFLNSQPLYDDLGELMVYETQKVNEDAFKSTKKEGPILKDVKFTNESREFVKNIKGLIALNESREKRSIYFGFRVIGIVPKKKAEIDEIVEEDEDDPLKDLPLPEPSETINIGWHFYKLGSSSVDSKGKKGKSGLNEKDQQKQISIFIYSQPMLKPPYDDKGLPETGITLKFKYNMFKYDIDSLNYFADKRVKKQEEKKDKFEKVKKKKYDKEYPQAFIKKSEKQYTDISFTKGSGIDVYIDACRFLPDNVTVTKASSSLIRR